MLFRRRYEDMPLLSYQLLRLRYLMLLIFRRAYTYVAMMHMLRLRLRFPIRMLLRHAMLPCHVAADVSPSASCRRARAFTPLRLRLRYALRHDIARERAIYNARCQMLPADRLCSPLIRAPRRLCSPGFRIFRAECCTGASASDEQSELFEAYGDVMLARCRALQARVRKMRERYARRLRADMRQRILRRRRAMPYCLPLPLRVRRDTHGYVISPCYAYFARSAIYMRGAWRRANMHVDDMRVSVR